MDLEIKHSNKMKILAASATLLVLVIGVSASETTSGLRKKQEVNNLNKELNKELAKDYFVCSCIQYSLKKSRVNYDDGSSSSYIDFLSGYSFESLQKINQYARIFVDEKINFGIYEGKNFMIRKCLDYRSNNELDIFVNSLESENEKDK